MVRYKNFLLFLRKRAKSKQEKKLLSSFFSILTERIFAKSFFSKKQKNLTF
nr:MAG TPA: hypothetical protein [Caudoviricetes sp.]